MVSQPGPLSALSTEELTLLHTLVNRHAKAVQERAWWVSALHRAKQQNDGAALRAAQVGYQAARQCSQDAQAAVRLLREELLRGKIVQAK